MNSLRTAAAVLATAPGGTRPQNHDGEALGTTAAPAQNAMSRHPSSEADESLLELEVALTLDGTFGGLLDAWLADACTRCGASERAALHSTCKRIREAVGHLRLGELDEQVLQTYLDGLAAHGYAARTVENHRRVLRRVCAYGRQAGVLEAELGPGLARPAAYGSQRTAASAAVPPRAVTAQQPSRVPPVPSRLPKPKMPNAAPQHNESPAQAQVLVLGSPSVEPKPTTALDPMSGKWQEFRLGQRW